jgi:hypothetical protein
LKEATAGIEKGIPAIYELAVTIQSPARDSVGNCVAAIGGMKGL